MMDYNNNDKIIDLENNEVFASGFLKGKDFSEIKKFNKLLENYISDIEILDFEMDEDELDIEESIKMLEDIETEKE